MICILELHDDPADGDGYYLRGVLADGRFVDVLPLFFGAARLLVGRSPIDADDEWSYESPWLAVRAAMAWNPAHSAEPAGWIRHTKTGRRRPGGDPNKEYVHF